MKYGALVMMLIVVVFTDLRQRRIPHAITVFGIALGLGSVLFVPVDDRPLGWLAERLGWFPPQPVIWFLSALLERL